MAACQKALGVTELLEGVLHNLPSSDFLKLVTVSNYWQHTLKTCPEFQRKLYLQQVATMGPLERIVVPESRLMYTVRLFLQTGMITQHHVDYFINQRVQVVFDGTPSHVEVCVSAVKLNPQFDRRFCRYHGPSDEEYPPPMTPLGSKLSSHHHRDLRSASEETFFGSVVLAQPPCTRVHLVGRAVRQDESHVERHDEGTENAESIKLEDLLRAMLKSSGSNEIERKKLTTTMWMTETIQDARKSRQMGRVVQLSTIGRLA